MDFAPQEKIVELEKLLEVALEAARVAGQISRRHFLDRRLIVDSKEDGTLVTRADREAEEAMREILRRGAPELGIFGEEYGHEGDARDRWIIDPIDGTHNFIDGVPHFAVLIGLQLAGQSVLGLVHSSVLGEQQGATELQGQSWWGGPEVGAWKGPGTTTESVRAFKLQCRPCSKLEDAFITHGGLKHIQNAGLWDPFTEIITSSRRNRGYGDWFGHMLIAEGVCDGMVDPRVALYDLAAVEPILHAAGAVLIASEPHPLHDSFLGQAVSGTAPIADELARRLDF
ncbi:MAG: inositol monophosphatase family protein [Planctomycetota bacterium]|nr:inositol monophosphatase family protein [Planctomycetota bacterium]